MALDFIEKMKDLSEVFAHGAEVVNKAIELDKGGETLIAFVGQVTLAVVSGGTDIPSALAALKNLNIIIMNLKAAEAAVK